VGSRSPRALSPKFSGELPAADHALGLAGRPVAQAPVGGDEPVGAVELRRLAGDPVVGYLFRPLEDDPRVDTFALGPGLNQLGQLVTWDVRPEGTADVLCVDEDDRFLRQL
jgi:hypothetical protein